MDALSSDPDLLFVIGVTLAIFCVPSLISAWSDARRPRASALTVVIATVMISIAFYRNPQGYQLSEIPTVFAEVLGRYLL